MAKLIEIRPGTACLVEQSKEPEVDDKKHRHAFVRSPHEPSSLSWMSCLGIVW
jgi:hypothetical protein